MASTYIADKFDWEKDYPIEELLQCVIAIKEFPNQLARILPSLSEEQLNATYREGSWTVRQIVHHLADAHMNAFLRCKHMLSGDQPEIQPWNHENWATEMDYQFNHEASFMIILGVHQRWSLLMLECLKNPTEYLAKSMYHPQQKKHISLAQMMALYSWHGTHHLHQIQFAIQSLNESL